jgi:pimeloyl-ACP methyl ester carboxylesterase
MKFSQKYYELKSQFNPLAVRTDFSGSGISCHAFRFNSAYDRDILHEGLKTAGDNALFAVPDEQIPENQSFTYYVFTPGTGTRYCKAILLLHGLNERSWVKYLAWAYDLAERTGHPVILFPIAFHMNRSPEAWGNPRIMQPLLALRKQKFGNDPVSTFANVALSERLTEEPLRFYTSGQQSAADLVSLCSQIVRGEHPLFEMAAKVNVFAYSIGAFLAQILFLANPEELFSSSKLFLFCGGDFFNEMNGVSRLIMDNQAFERLMHFYIHDLTCSRAGSEPLAEAMKKTSLGQAFLAMLAPAMMQSFRESRYRQISDKIQAVSLTNDQVIPACHIAHVLGRGADIEILDFPFGYTHETPFPLNNSQLFPQVDEGFEKVFSKAARFLS